MKDPQRPGCWLHPTCRDDATCNYCHALPAYTPHKWFMFVEHGAAYLRETGWTEIGPALWNPPVHSSHESVGVAIPQWRAICMQYRADGDAWNNTAHNASVLENGGGILFTMYRAVWTPKRRGPSMGNFSSGYLRDKEQAERLVKLIHPAHPNHNVSLETTTWFSFDGGRTGHRVEIEAEDIPLEEIPEVLR